MTKTTQQDQQNERDEKSKHYWHPAFQGAMHLAWRKNKHNLEIRGEEELGQMPSVMDMLVIVKKQDLKLEDPIGAGFRGLNILEFKSPSDDMHIDTFYKVLSYACLYKSQGSTVDLRKVDDITITLLRSAKPINLLRVLEQVGGTITRQGAGVYNVKGMSLFDTRIIAYDELPECDDYIYLKSLSENITHDLGKKLISMGQDFQDEDDKRDVNAVLHLTMKKHREVFKKIFAEDDMVIYEAYKEFFRDVLIPDELARTKAEGKAEGVISMCRDFGLSDAEIIGHISSKLNCSQTEATSLYHQYGSAQQVAGV